MSQKFPSSQEGNMWKPEWTEHSPTKFSNAWPLVSVIVLNHNGLEQIKSCFQAVLSINYPHYEVIFVDNGSDDGSLEFAKQIAEDSSLSPLFIEMKENVGYSRGKNVGASASKGDYVWLLDNDIKPEPDCLRKLICFMINHPGVSLCGPILVDYSDHHKVVGGGYLMSYFPQPRPCLDVFNKIDAYRYVSFISGAVIFIRKKVWNHLGGFEDSGKFFLDDNDLGPRCWIAGWKVALVFDCFVMHFQVSRPSHNYWRWKFRQSTPGIVRGMIRNYSFKSLMLSMPVFFGYTLLKSFKNAIFRLDPRIILDCLVSLFQAVRGIPESFRQRQQVQQLRVIPNDVFLKLEV